MGVFPDVAVRGPVPPRSPRASTRPRGLESLASLPAVTRPGGEGQRGSPGDAATAACRGQGPRRAGPATRSDPGICFQARAAVRFPSRSPRARRTRARAPQPLGKEATVTHPSGGGRTDTDPLGERCTGTDPSGGGRTGTYLSGGARTGTLPSRSGACPEPALRESWRAGTETPRREDGRRSLRTPSPRGPGACAQTRAVGLGRRTCAPGPRGEEEN